MLARHLPSFRFSFFGYPKDPLRIHIGDGERNVRGKFDATAKN
jgi:hypothetical protein